VNPEGGSPSCCAAALGSTNLTTAAPPTGTATTRPTSTPTTVFAPAVSSPQHPSPSEPLGGIPAGVHEGSRPAPVITGPAGESAQNPPTASSRQALLAWWAFHLAHSVNNCPTTSCTRPDAFGSLFGDGGHGRVMMSVERGNVQIKALAVHLLQQQSASTRALLTRTRAPAATLHPLAPARDSTSCRPWRYHQDQQFSDPTAQLRLSRLLGLRCRCEGRMSKRYENRNNGFPDFATFPRQSARDSCFCGYMPPFCHLV
jgi:hypothetical protein